MNTSLTKSLRPTVYNAVVYRLAGAGVGVGVCVSCPVRNFFSTPVLKMMGDQENSDDQGGRRGGCPVAA
jgi:hypothetical protein